jgi:hypothetical protein
MQYVRGAFTNCLLVLKGHPPAGGTSKLRLGPMGEAVEAVLSISTENFIQVPNSDREWKEVRKRS